MFERKSFPQLHIISFCLLSLLFIHSSAWSATYIDNRCFTSTATFVNYNLLYTPSGQFTLEFDATPNAKPMNGVTAFAAKDKMTFGADSYDNYAVLVRFNSSGYIDARNGASYNSSTYVYKAGELYHFRLDVDVANKRYSVYVKPEGGTEALIGVDLAFRTTQTQITQIDTLGLRADTGSHSVCNLVISQDSSSLSPYYPPATRLGLHFTKEEVEIWKQRAVNGPYKSDWDVIKKNADSFVAGNSRWDGSSLPGRKRDVGLRDAGLVYLITGDSKYRNAVRDALIAQTKISGTDFSDRSEWDVGLQGTKADWGVAASKGFETSNWLRRLTYGYDYIKNDLNASDRAAIEAWLSDGGDYFRDVVFDSASHFFPNRLDNRCLGSSCPGHDKGPTHYGGYMTSSVQWPYENIPCTHAATFAAIGIAVNDSSLKRDAKIYFKEWMMYAVYPNGTVLDQRRWNDVEDDGSHMVEKGYYYPGTAIGSIITIADHFARIGDYELYEYSTSLGYLETAGGPKSLLKILRDYSGMTVGNIKKIASKTYTSNPDYIIDPSGPNDNYVTFVTLSPANLYYKDSLIKQAYSTSIPSSYGAGGYDPLGGEWGNYPGVRFLFFDLEGKVWPYPQAGPTADTPGCYNSSSSFQNHSLIPQTGNFSLEFDATPNGNAIDAVIALSLGPKTTHSDFSVLVRFNTDAKIEAFDNNTGWYAAKNAISYSAGVTYHFRIVVDMSKQTYDAYVGTTLLADDYAFRTPVNSLDNWGLISSVGSCKVCNLKVVSMPASVSIIIDDTNTSCVKVGTWSISGGASPYGSSSVYSKTAGNTATWSAALFPGTYNVYAWWTTYDNRTPDAPYKIYNGSTLLATVHKDQRSQGGQWVLLGKYTFDTLGKVMLTVPSNPSAYSYCADAIKFEKAEEKIIDNKDSGCVFVGSWSVSGGASPYNSDSVYSKTQGHSASWSAALTPGVYSVYAWWTTYDNRTPDAPYKIYNGSTLLATVHKDQRSQGGQWVLLGKYTFDTLGKVMLTVPSNPSAYSYCADAIKFEK